MTRRDSVPDERTAELAMPIIYLQRHTVELLLKELRLARNAL